MNKADLIAHLRKMLLDKVEEAQLSIASTRAARDGDTKSSAGDKHEVGREMAQQELNAQEAQLAKTQHALHELSRLPDNSNGPIGLGSLVQTDKGLYFLSIALGKVELAGEQVFVVSMASPIGQALLGKRVSDEVEFNQRRIVVEAVG